MESYQKNYCQKDRSSTMQSEFLIDKLYVKPLCHVLSLSIRQGVFQNELKLAKVLPI